MTILIDVDNTFWNFAETLLRRLNHICQTNYTNEDIKSWEWFRETYDNPFRATEELNFWQKVTPYNHAVEVIEYLQGKGHKIYFVTASKFNKGLPDKIDHLLSFFNPNLLNDSNVIIAKDKYMINGDILIDDAMHNLENFHGTKIRFIQPWNHAHAQIPYGVNSWLGVKSLVDFIDNKSIKK